jgi:hypothetical protein
MPGVENVLETRADAFSVWLGHPHRPPGIANLVRPFSMGQLQHVMQDHRPTILLEDWPTAPWWEFKSDRVESRHLTSKC